MTVDTKWVASRGFSVERGCFFCAVTAMGNSSSIPTVGHQIELDGSDRYVVDTSHIVAFTEGSDFKINKIGGMKLYSFG